MAARTPVSRGAADRIARWFLPISGKLEVGGSYQLQGHANGTVLTSDPPKNFTATWESGGNVSWIGAWRPTAASHD